MEVALGLFYEKGIYWTKIEDITERADVGKGTFYQYFGTKEDLLAALLERGLDQFLLQAREAGKGGRSGRALLNKIVADRLQFFVNNPEYLLLLHQIRGLLQLKTDASKQLREIYSTHLDRLGELLRPALNGGGTRGLSGRDFAIALGAFTSGMLTYHLLFDKAEGFKQKRTAILAQLQDSLKALL
jgi:AcrR family transcriptional regulator